jgi:hypothetical protein
MTRKRLGFFTRLLDDAPAKERYRLATEQIRHAGRVGYDTAPQSVFVRLTGVGKKFH